MEAAGYLKTKSEMFNPYDYYRLKKMQSGVLGKWQVPGRAGDGGEAV